MSVSKFFRNFLALPQMISSYHQNREKEYENWDLRLQQTKESRISACRSAEQQQQEDHLDVVLVDTDQVDVELATESQSDEIIKDASSTDIEREPVAASDDECRSIVSLSNTESYEDADCQAIEMEEEGNDEEAVIESGVANFAASAEETPLETSSPEEQIQQNHLIPANDGHLNNGISRSDNFCNADNVSEREVATIGESRIQNTIPRAKFAQSHAEDNSSRTSIGIKRKVSVRTGIVYEDEISSHRSLSITQTLPSSDLSEAVEAVKPPSYSRSVVRDLRASSRPTFRRYVDAASRAKLPPGATLLSKRGVYLIKGEEKPFACAYCGKAYKRKLAVYCHIRYHHDEKRYSCEFCGKQFAEPSQLASHARIHMQEKPFTCDQCGKQFRSSFWLREHTATHSNEKPFPCNQCDKSCKTKRSLSQHIRYHKVQQQMKDVRCDVCKKWFATPYVLKNHMVIHTGEKPFKCTLCEKQFRLKTSLLVHMDLHSGKKRLAKDPCSICGKTLWASRMPDHMNMHAGVKPFECNVCGKRFPKKQNLEGHMRSHTGEKPFACVGCDKRFALYSNMVTHKAKCSKLISQGT